MSGGAGISWPIVALLLGVLGGTAYLGNQHVMSSSDVSNIYLAVVSGGVVGHFATRGIGGGP